jgi:hypothetical protein
MLKPGGVAFFGMINREEGTFLGPYFRNESWWPSITQRCGFESVTLTSNFTEWRGGPVRYHAYLRKGRNFLDDLRAMLPPSAESANGKAKGSDHTNGDSKGRDSVTKEAERKKNAKKWKKPKKTMDVE